MTEPLPDTPVPAQPASRRGRLRWPATLAVLVVAVGVGTYLAFFRSSGTAAPNQVVAGFAKAYTALERHPDATTLAAFERYLCPRDVRAAGPVYGTMVATKQPGDPGVTVVASRPRVAGDSATFTVTIEDTASPPLTVRGHLTHANGTWQVCHTM